MDTWMLETDWGRFGRLSGRLWIFGTGAVVFDASTAVVSLVGERETLQISHSQMSKCKRKGRFSRTNPAMKPPLRV